MILIMILSMLVTFSIRLVGYLPRLHSFVRYSRRVLALCSLIGLISDPSLCTGSRLTKYILHGASLLYY